MPGSADEVAIIAQFTARRGRESELLSLLQGLLEPTRREDGCLRYELNREVEGPRCFTFVERFRSSAAYEAHLASKHVRHFAELSADLVESRTVRLYRQLTPLAEGGTAITQGAETRVVVIAHFTAKPEKEQELSSFLRGLVEPSRSEPGCLRYELNQDLHDFSTFSLVEMFADRQAFDAHCDQPYIHALFEVLPALVDQQYIGLHRQVLE
jgi:quinol monooxygenase YgiN